jgi:hypothetical protein
MFLTVVDMTDGDDSEQLLQESTPLGITVRAWFGVKLVGLPFFRASFCRD